jgi:choline-sulfatase
MADRPNVLLVCTDQQPWFALGSVDDSFETPHLDCLADRGTPFTGCHSTHPQCSPARSSIVTGQYPHQMGMETLFTWGPGDLDPDSPSVGRAFREAGYETAYFGRWDLGADNVEALSWETHGLDVTGTPGRAGRDRDARALADALSFVADRGDGDPFFLTASFNLPHPAYFEDESFALRYDRDTVPLPPTFDDDLEDRPAFQHDRAAEFDLDEPRVRDVNYRFRTMVSRVDDYVGQLLDGLEGAGVRDETVVAFTADHGDMLGAHGFLKKGVVAYDEILRVPLIVDVPGRESRRDRIPDLVSLADLPGTLLDAAGVPAPDFPGESVLDAFDRDSPPADERVFFEHKYAYWGEHPYRGVRTRDWKYVEYLADDTDELYHMAEDPGETTNLAGGVDVTTDQPGGPDYDHHETRLRDLVREWWDETGGDTQQWTEPIER